MNLSKLKEAKGTVDSVQWEIILLEDLCNIDRCGDDDSFALEYATAKLSIIDAWLENRLHTLLDNASSTLKGLIEQETSEPEPETSNGR